MRPIDRSQYFLPHTVGQLLVEPTHMGVESTASSDRWRELDEKSEMQTTGLVIFCLLGVVPLLITTALVGSLLFSTARKLTVAPPPTASKTVVPVMATVAPIIPAGPAAYETVTGTESVCNTNECRSLSERLRLQLKFSVDPCDDFYDFVCGKYWGHVEGALSEAEALIRSATIAAIDATTVPATGQKAWHKAAALFKACMTLASLYHSEVGDLTVWLASLGLDLNHLDPSVDPVDMVMRSSLDFGVPAVFDATLSDRLFIEGKRSIEFRLSYVEDLWYMHRHRMLTKSIQDTVNYYVTALAPYGVSAQNATLAYKILDYENELIKSLNKHLKAAAVFVIGTIEEMGLTTPPHLEPAQWGEMFSRYTNGVYGGHDKIAYQKELLSALAELLGLPSAGPAGLRCLVAWSLFRQLLPYARPPLDTGGKQTLYSCYNRVGEVMELALTSHYLQSAVNAQAVHKALDVFATVREAFGAAIQNSSWLVGTERSVALRKLANMKVLIGGPEQRWDEPYVDQYYEGLPDAPSDRFFIPWLKARSVSTHRRWSDQTNFLFDIGKVNAFYERDTNVVIVPAALLQPVFFFPNGNEAFNYGGLGDVMAHEITHGYDVLGVQYDDDNQLRPWSTPQSRQHYVNNVICLRGSHSQVLRRKRHLQLDDTIDSENLADFVGAAIAYAAFHRLPSFRKQWTLPGLHLTPDQLFFVGRCTKTCRIAEVTTSTRYATASSRCNVPLMNMEPFARAFRCRVGTRMNPNHKCSFWA
ncbi:neprilysin-11-like [Rhipicephalus sanguineus]|uniref:neprilysin-11-like n=1 Tax=Rhipicephalus sanguineus TaxID=34632 RepID=UPI001895352F|nr:neprilysin-11-like [Rhipicephalus sanguineus]